MKARYRWPHLLVLLISHMNIRGFTSNSRFGSDILALLFFSIALLFEVTWFPCQTPKVICTLCYHLLC
jgi:hypothetical protein